MAESTRQSISWWIGPAPGNPSRRFPDIGDMRQEMQRIAVASGAMPWRVGPSQEAKHARAGRVFLRLLARISSARDWLAAKWRWTMLPFLAAVAVEELLGVVLFGSGCPKGSRPSRP